MCKILLLTFTEQQEIPTVCRFYIKSIYTSSIIARFILYSYRTVRLYVRKCIDILLQKGRLTRNVWPIGSTKHLWPIKYLYCHYAIFSFYKLEYYKYKAVARSNIRFYVPKWVYILIKIRKIRKKCRS